MSKYQKLWEYIGNSGEAAVSLTFEEIAAIAGVPVDHSFLRYKKELIVYGFQVEKISIKEEKVRFSRVAR